MAFRERLSDVRMPSIVNKLRHSLASLMQVRGVSTTYAQTVMGHTSRTNTFDTYGSGVPAEVLAKMLKEVFCMNALLKAS